MTDCPTLHPQVAIQTVDGLAVMVLADSGEVLVLNPLGTRILELIDDNRSVTEIANAIEADYAVSAEDARRDLETFLQTLLEAGALLSACKQASGRIGRAKQRKNRTIYLGSLLRQSVVDPGGGKIFAVLALDPATPHRLSFKCTPEKFAELLELDGIIPAPYMARNKWVTLERFDALADAEIKALLENSYALVFAKLTKKMQAQLKPG
jgi:predicted DNA-binding protein (MmcQ/YjbR family)